MALPAVAAKIAASILANSKEGQNALKGVMIAVSAPFLLVAVVICGIFNAFTTHNDDIVSMVFSGGTLSSEYPPEYAEEIVSMQNKFIEIDEMIVVLDVDFLDHYLVKSYFFALYFGESASVDVDEFVNHFIISTRGVQTSIDEDGNTIYTFEIGESAVTDMSLVYNSIFEKTGHEVTDIQKQNALEIYYRVKYGVIAPTYGEAFDDFIVLGRHFDSVKVRTNSKSCSFRNRSCAISLPLYSITFCRDFEKISA